MIIKNEQARMKIIFLKRDLNGISGSVKFWPGLGEAGVKSCSYIAVIADMLERKPRVLHEKSVGHPSSDRVRQQCNTTTPQAFCSLKILPQPGRRDSNCCDIYVTIVNFTLHIPAWGILLKGV